MLAMRHRSHAAPLSIMCLKERKNGGDGGRHGSWVTNTMAPGRPGAGRRHRSTHVGDARRAVGGTATPRTPLPERTLPTLQALAATCARLPGSPRTKKLEGDLALGSVGWRWGLAGRFASCVGGACSLQGDARGRGDCGYIVCLSSDISGGEMVSGAPARSVRWPVDHHLTSVK